MTIYLKQIKHDQLVGKYNERFFRNEISENIFLSKYYHERKRINGVDYNNILTYYKRLRECDYLV